MTTEIKKEKNTMWKVTRAAMHAEVLANMTRTWFDRSDAEFHYAARICETNPAPQLVWQLTILTDDVDNDLDAGIRFHAQQAVKWLEQLGEEVERLTLLDFDTAVSEFLWTVQASSFSYPHTAKNLMTLAQLRKTFTKKDAALLFDRFRVDQYVLDNEFAFMTANRCVYALGDPLQIKRYGTYGREEFLEAVLKEGLVA